LTDEQETSAMSDAQHAQKNTTFRFMDNSSRHSFN